MKCDNCGHYVYMFSHTCLHSIKDYEDDEGVLIKLTKKCEYKDCQCKSPQRDSIEIFKESMVFQ